MSSVAQSQTHKTHKTTSALIISPVILICCALNYNVHLEWWYFCYTTKHKIQYIILVDIKWTLLIHDYYYFNINSFHFHGIHLFITYCNGNLKTHPSLRTIVESTGRPCALLGEEITSRNWNRKISNQLTYKVHLIIHLQEMHWHLRNKNCQNSCNKKSCSWHSMNELKTH